MYYRNVAVQSFAAAWNMVETKLMNDELVFIMVYLIGASPTLIIITAIYVSIYVCIITTDELTVHVKLFCDIHIDTKARHRAYYSACRMRVINFVDVESYRLTVLRHHWHCCVCSYCHNIITRSQYSMNALVIHCFLIKTRCYCCDA